MSVKKWRFEFHPDVPLAEVERTLHLVFFGVEGLFGRARVRLECRYRLDEPHRAIIVESASEVGVAVVRIFAALAAREFGDDAFSVGRARPRPVHAEAVA